MNPFVRVSNRDQRYWSEWMESVRKDVECLFGRLKSRFRFLKNSIELHQQAQIDNVFFTCCILHNMILMYDGLDSRWEDYVNWEELDPVDDASAVNGARSKSTSRGSLLRSRVNANLNLIPESSIRGNITIKDIDPSHQQRREELVVHFRKMYEMRRNKNKKSKKSKVLWAKGLTAAQRKENRLR